MIQLDSNLNRFNSDDNIFDINTKNSDNFKNPNQGIQFQSSKLLVVKQARLNYN